MSNPLKKLISNILGQFDESIVLNNIKLTPNNYEFVKEFVIDVVDKCQLAMKDLLTENEELNEKVDKCKDNCPIRQLKNNDEIVSGRVKVSVKKDGSLDMDSVIREILKDLGDKRK